MTWLLGNSKGGKQYLPANYAGMSDRWALQFNKGRDYGSAWTHEQNTPAISQGCAYWLGWRHVVLERGIKPPDNDNTMFIDSEEEIASILQSCPLRPQQWRHWTGCEGPQDVTAVIVELYEGEIVEMWMSSSGTYFLNGSHWEPVPTQYWA